MEYENTSQYAHSETGDMRPINQWYDDEGDDIIDDWLEEGILTEHRYDKHEGMWWEVV